MSKKIILLAEDNPDDAFLTVHALEEANVANQIIHVKDGVETLDYLLARGDYSDRDPNQLPSLLLLDLNMPKVNGLEVLQEVRTNPITKTLPVVILTTSKQEEDVMKSYQLGVNSYVRKPVDFNEFTEAAKTLGMYWMLLNERPEK